MAAQRKRTMGKDHKEALAVGRTEGRAVRSYLEALEAHRPKRGRRRTPASIESRLASIEEQTREADPLKRLQLAQEKLELADEFARFDQGDQLGDLEARFVKVAKSYAERKGISYAAFRQVGVPAAVLKQAGITRTS